MKGSNTKAQFSTKLASVLTKFKYLFIDSGIVQPCKSDTNRPESCSESSRSETFSLLLLAKWIQLNR